MNFDITKYVNYLLVSGSHSYGMNTATSDFDIRGFCIPPKEYFTSFHLKFEQHDAKFWYDDFPWKDQLREYCGIDTAKLVSLNEDIDYVVYGLHKFIKLAVDCNPSIIEYLFVDPEEILICDKFAQKLIDNRDLFLSTKAKYSFTGYAISQLKRINTHRKWILNPPSKKPERKEYGLPERSLISPDQRSAAAALLTKQVRLWTLEEAEVPKHLVDLIQEDLAHLIANITLCKEDEIENKIEAVAAKEVGIDENFLHVLKKEKAYRNALNHYNQYENWKTTRNPARAKLEEKYGYDCYLSDTEFLTDSGWKVFDTITENDKLATVFISPTGKNLSLRKHLGVEYQNYYDKFDGTFTGEMYKIIGNHLDSVVTPNHNMLYRKRERRSNKLDNFTLGMASHLPDTFDILLAPNPKIKQYETDEELDNIPIPTDAFIRLMGWFLSEGTFQFRNGLPHSIVISQKDKRGLSRYMKEFVNNYKDKVKCVLYSYTRKATKVRNYEIDELRLVITEKSIVEKLYSECGHSFNKRIPRWLFNVSKRRLDLLLTALLRGDGTIRNTGLKTNIYYSSLKGLADDVQELALHCGYETSLYGPYVSFSKATEKDCTMYQVHINQNKENIKTLVRCKNIRKEYYKNARIVCFSVPNGTLITRRNGHIGIHGNSKHASHLIRLICEAKDILYNGTLIVKDKERAQFLLSIRDGAMTYDQLMVWVDENMKELDQRYSAKNCMVPPKPDINKIDALVQELVEESWQN